MPGDGVLAQNPAIDPLVTIRRPAPAPDGDPPGGIPWLPETLDWRQEKVWRWGLAPAERVAAWALLFLRDVLSGREASMPERRRGGAASGERPRLGRSEAEDRAAAAVRAAARRSRRARACSTRLRRSGHGSGRAEGELRGARRAPPRGRGRSRAERRRPALPRSRPARLGRRRPAGAVPVRVRVHERRNRQRARAQRTFARDQARRDAGRPLRRLPETVLAGERLAVGTARRGAARDPRHDRPRVARSARRTVGSRSRRSPFRTTRTSATCSRSSGGSGSSAGRRRRRSASRRPSRTIRAPRSSTSSGRQWRSIERTHEDDTGRLELRKLALLRCLPGGACGADPAADPRGGARAGRRDRGRGCRSRLEPGSPTESAGPARFYDRATLICAAASLGS